MQCSLKSRKTLYAILRDKKIVIGSNGQTDRFVLGDFVLVHARLDDRPKIDNLLVTRDPFGLSALRENQGYGRSI
jgi:hypothetical protein